MEEGLSPVTSPIVDPPRKDMATINFGPPIVQFPVVLIERVYKFTSPWQWQPSWEANALALWTLDSQDSCRNHEKVNNLI